MHKMKDKQVEATMADWRKAYAAGTLPQWRIDRIEKIKRWVWEVERGVRPKHDLDVPYHALAGDGTVVVQ